METTTQRLKRVRRMALIMSEALKRLTYELPREEHAAGIIIRSGLGDVVTKLDALITRAEAGDLIAATTAELYQDVPIIEDDATLRGPSATA